MERSGFLGQHYLLVQTLDPADNPSLLMIPEAVGTMRGIGRAAQSSG